MFLYSLSFHMYAKNKNKKPYPLEIVVYAHLSHHKKRNLLKKWFMCIEYNNYSKLLFVFETMRFFCCCLHLSPEGVISKQSKTVKQHWWLAFFCHHVRSLK